MSEIQEFLGKFRRTTGNRFPSAEGLWRHLWDEEEGIVAAYQIYLKPLEDGTRKAAYWALGNKSLIFMEITETHFRTLSYRLNKSKLIRRTYLFDGGGYRLNSTDITTNPKCGLASFNFDEPDRRDHMTDYQRFISRL